MIQSLSFDVEMAQRWDAFVAIVFALIVATPGVENASLRPISEVIPCSSLNVSALSLVTFDLFGALMLTEASLEKSITRLVPSLSTAQIKRFTDDWLSAYASYFGKSLPPSLTHQPFQWIIRTSLVKILDSFQLSKTIPEGSTTFEALVAAWGDLQPRPEATEVLAKLSQKYQLGLLSNGDTNTLRSALRGFPSSVNVSVILSSDYPVNCFKPCSEMYAQALTAVHGDLSKVIHVAGSAFDAHGARTFGIFAGALDSSAKHTSPEPCFAFDDITQLLSFFEL